MLKVILCNGKEFVVSDDVKFFGLNSVWSVAEEAQRCNNVRLSKRLREVHTILAAVLYGKVVNDESKVHKVSRKKEAT